ncbi:MAG: acyl-CoA dehydrogenase [Candidatus Deianiraeaceae bacterium]|jgi:acyl-CoA dehydrogenase
MFILITLTITILLLAILISLYNRFSSLIVVIAFNGIILFLYLKALYITLPISFLLITPFLRKYIITAVILRFIRKKNLLPQISETEEVALNAGNIWVESEFFTGKPNFLRIIKEPYSEISEAEQNFLNNEVEELCGMVSDQQIHELQDLPHNVWEYIRQKKFFGMIIPKSYGGLEFSPIAQSKVVAKLATRSQALSITVMVPNSLGPAELLLKYGTEKQKSYYIPRLACGDDIPCFALTEPTAGSDASSITADGEVFQDSNNRLKIRLNFQKRYITLGGVATLIGLAFKVKDPKNLLPPLVSRGITCALLQGNAKGLTRGRRHKPMGVPFINSPLWGKNIVVDVEDDVIGGMNGVGKGWKMLMECLSVGRGISLPAISYGGSVLASYVSMFHANIRRQFGLPLAKFEAIQEKLADSFAKTYSIDAMRTFVASAVGVGHTPSVANAMVKYHATEHSRDVINHAMDILAGNAICMGEKNLIANLYLASPIGITVEGANVLTRSLLQFGQGIMRCHPFLLKQVYAIKENNLHTFDKNFWQHAYSFASNAVRTFFLTITNGKISRPMSANLVQKYNAKLNYVSARFTLLADYALITYGGALKRKEFLSSRFADVASYMFLITSVLKKFASNNFEKAQEPVVEYICNLYLYNIQEAFNQISENISRSNALGSVLNITGAFAHKRIVKNPVKWKNIESVVKYYTDSNTLSKEEIFIPNNKNEQIYKLFTLFNQEKIVVLIEKKIKNSEYKSPKDALQANIITQKEFDEIVQYRTLCNEAIQVNHFELKSSINNEN